jgi:GGDEF domain-containing protein
VLLQSEHCHSHRDAIPFHRAPGKDWRDDRADLANCRRVRTDIHSVLHDPPLVIVPAATIIAVALLLVALIRSDIEHRGASLIDDLTGVWNQQAYYQHAEALEQRAQRTGDPGAVIVLDLDSFKLVNDLHGHSAGDKVLADIAQRIRGERRALELIYRYGGEEFVALLLPGAELEEATTFVSAFRLARPDSWWARRYYQGKKLDRAVTRYSQ